MVESRISWRTPSSTIQRRGTKQRDRPSIPFTGADDVGCTIGDLALAIAKFVSIFVLSFTPSAMPPASCNVLSRNPNQLRTEEAAKALGALPAIEDAQVTKAG
jgi:hypothetical protein